jgi:hypothetical protein
VPVPHVDAMVLFLLYGPCDTLLLLLLLLLLLAVCFPGRPGASAACGCHGLLRGAVRVHHAPPQHAPR